MSEQAATTAITTATTVAPTAAPLPAITRAERPHGLRAPPPELVHLANAAADAILSQLGGRVAYRLRANGFRKLEASDYSKQRSKDVAALATIVLETLLVAVVWDPSTADSSAP